MTQNLSYQQRRAARLDDPSFEKLRNPRTRRRLAFSLIGLIVLEVAAFGVVTMIPLDGAVSVIAFLGVMVVIIFVMVMLLGALKASTRGVEELSPDVLDERQAQLRGEIFKRSYGVLSVVALIACLLVALMGQSWWPLNDSLNFTVVAVLVQLVAIIPTLVTALRVRV